MNNEPGNNPDYNTYWHAGSREPDPPPMEETPPDADMQHTKKTLSLVRTLIGIALILIGAALLTALLNWLWQDIKTSLQFFQSEIQ